MSEPRPVAVIVLAAGEGTRMKSRIPKVLHPLCGRSMLGHVLAAAGELDPQRTVIVAGHRREEVSAEAVRYAADAIVVVQDRQAGTGHAVRMVIEALGIMPGVVLVTYGDMPLLRAQTLAELVREHAAAGNAVTVLTARVGDPAGYGRIIRDDRGSLTDIMEDADATPEQRHVAAGHQHDARHDAEGLDHHAHGVTGARLAVLHDGDHLRHVPRGLGPDLLPAVPGDDHRAPRVELAGRGEHVP